MERHATRRARDITQSTVSGGHLAPGSHPANAAAYREADERFDNSNRMTAPRLSVGNPRRRLKDRAAWFGVEALVLTQSDWTVNFGMPDDLQHRLSPTTSMNSQIGRHASPLACDFQLAEAR
ncbi:hypothetical protein ABZ702_26545 [Streptomyces cyaneofuscatus]|uniref:hypothetical protein n=1 Tax=Streptomyces cyaneofuscatus TaxID=66883 RepID=UPI0033E76B1E